MIDQLERCWWRVYYDLVGTVTISEALRQTVGPKLVREALAAGVQGSQLLEYAAAHGEFDRRALLEETAELLQLKVCMNPDLPGHALIELTSYSAEELEAAGAVPLRRQTGGGKYGLAVADPTIVAVEDYAAIGVPVYLAYHGDVQRVWQRYAELRAAGAIDERKLTVILLQLAKDAGALGANEVFVGHPEPSTYEFVVGGQKFTGRLHFQVYESLLRRFAEQDEPASLRFAAGDGEIAEISCTLTKNFANPVIFLSWGDAEKGAGRPTAANGRSNGHAPRRKAKRRPTSFRRNEETVDCGAEPAGAKKLILLVDDDSKFAAVLSGVFNRRGYLVVYRSGGQEALEYLEEGILPDLIVSDVYMPRMDGVELLLAVKSRWRNLPVLMLTSDEDPTIQVELINHRADAFIGKQEDVRILLAWCASLARQADRGATVGDVQEAVRESPNGAGGELGAG